MKRVAALILLATLCARDAFAFDPFTIADIRVDGTERISAGTVYSYLPVEKGDSIDNARAAEAVRALFKTGFFNDVELDREGDILVVKVTERPAISKVNITGNKDIKEEDLRKAFREIGLNEGDTYDRLALERAISELQRQYNNRGKYNVGIEGRVRKLARNRVQIDLTIAEGNAAKIKHFNIVGNETFADTDIREDFESNTTNWLSWYKSDDQYSREKLSGDLEKLQAYYQDRGYAEASVESTQVAISPDRSNIYVTANIREGEVYQIGEVKLTGNLVLEEAQLRPLIRIKRGDTFSQRRVEQSSEAITRVLTNLGYAFAEVNPIPTLDRDKKAVEVIFLVNPGPRVYVRRIAFKGNTRTQDEVLRREMRQFEGGWYSQAAIDRSKVRLRRLGYFKSVNIETPKVAGTEDQVDLEVAVEEQSSGAFQFGFGYSQLQGLLTSLSVSQRNFLGSGNSVNVTVQNNRIVKRFDFSYYDPYFTDSGVSLGYNLRYSEIDQRQANIAAYTSQTTLFSVISAIPLTETDTVSASLGIERNALGLLAGFSPQPFIDYIDDVGHRTFHTWRLEAGWARDSRNRFFAPTRGTYQRLFAEIALPGSTAEYYKLQYQFSHYFPLRDWATLLTSVDLGYGDGYGNGEVLPFFENFYGGGVVSGVRGFEDNTLGPCFRALGNTSTDCQPLGGALKAVGTAEVIFPTPFLKRGEDSTQLSAFLDVGNVFEDFSAFDTGELRASAGLSFKWQAPVGPIVINLSTPLKSKDDDRTETIQFSFGNQF